MQDGPKAARASALEPRKSFSGCRFPESRRIRRRADYQTVFDRNRRLTNRHFRILVHRAENRSGARLGIVVTRRVSKKAFERNRIKRQVRECFRANQHQLISRDMVVIAQRASETAQNVQLRESLNKLFGQLEN